MVTEFVYGLSSMGEEQRHWGLYCVKPVCRLICICICVVVEQWSSITALDQRPVVQESLTDSFARISVSSFPSVPGGQADTLVAEAVKILSEANIMSTPAKMIIEAYAALLLAFLSKESKHVRDAIARGHAKSSDGQRNLELIAVCCCSMNDCLHLFHRLGAY